MTTGRINQVSLFTELFLVVRRRETSLSPSSLTQSLLMLEVQVKDEQQIGRQGSQCGKGKRVLDELSVKGLFG
jgi:hypothetical protein